MTKQHERTAFENQSDDTLEDDVLRLEEELRVFRKENGGRSRDAAHRKINALVARKRDEWETRVRDIRYAAMRGGLVEQFELDPALYMWTQPQIAKQLHAAIDAEHVPGDVHVEFLDLTEAEYVQRVHAMRQEIGAREDELKVRAARREAARVVEAAEAATRKRVEMGERELEQRGVQE